MSCLTLRTANVYIFFHPQTFCLDIGSIMTYILVVLWLDISITSAPYLRQRVFIIYCTVLFVIAFAAFHSIRSRIFHPLYTLVPRLPVPRFPPLHFWRCRLFRSRIFSRPGGNPSDLSCEESNGKASDANSRQSIHLALIKFNNNFFRGYAPNLAKSSVEWIVKFSLGHLVETSEMPSTLNVNTKVLNTALPIKNISIDGN